MSTVNPPGAPSWTDVVLASMGVLLAAGFAVGWASSVPLRVAGSLGALLAVAVLVVGLVGNPRPLSRADD